MSSASSSLKFMFLSVVRPITSLGSATKSTSLRAVFHPGQRPITYSVLQSTFRSVSTTSKVGSVATKKTKDSNDEEDDFESAAWESYDTVQETEKVDLYDTSPYNMGKQLGGQKLRSPKAKNYKINQFMKQYEVAATKLARTDQRALQMLEAVKAPMMGQIKPRSALIDSRVCSKFAL